MRSHDPTLMWLGLHSLFVLFWLPLLNRLTVNAWLGVVAIAMSIGVNFIFEMCDRRRPSVMLDRLRIWHCMFCATATGALVIWTTVHWLA